MILSINCMQTHRNKSCMWDRPRPSNFNILYIPAPCDRLAWRRLCPVCRTEASSTMRIFRPWCDSRRWQRDAAFWHSHCILLGICQNSATRTVRRCLKDAVSSGPWTFMYFWHTSPCWIHFEYNMCIIWSTRDFHFAIVSVPRVPCAVLICEAIGLRPCPGTVQEEARFESNKMSRLSARIIHVFFLAKPWHKLANGFHAPGSTMFGPAYRWCI